ncbi:hypothetical protein NBRC111894_2122 [Sporolactobacillus inulinus]|uniref:Uncharacterized protein n=1 Tax=Sporolactobacillus inulinus TaxID=2078 RepID=A0A4Y1ZD92_9BACL|nr:hypothetical protein NBRC111894_2122 [Sporolactobacillus inulinus]
MTLQLLASTGRDRGRTASLLGHAIYLRGLFLGSHQQGAIPRASHICAFDTLSLA